MNMILQHKIISLSNVSMAVCDVGQAVANKSQKFPADNVHKSYTCVHEKQDSLRQCLFQTYVGADNGVIKLGFTAAGSGATVSSVHAMVDESSAHVLRP